MRAYREGPPRSSGRLDTGDLHDQLDVVPLRISGVEIVERLAPDHDQVGQGEVSLVEPDGVLITHEGARR